MILHLFRFIAVLLYILVSCLDKSTKWAIYNALMCIDIFSYSLQTSNDGQVFYVEVEKGKWPLRNIFTLSPANVLFGVICVDRAIDINDFW